MNESKSESKDKSPSPITCPFTITVDTREQTPYLFAGLHEGSGARRRPLVVPTMRATLPTGDYSILELPGVAIERKSKADLFGSVVRRENFAGRLARMAVLSFSAVVVEAEWSEILKEPPRHSRFRPKSLFRTVIAWQVRHREVHWLFMPGRDAAEAATYRLLERFFKENRTLHAAMTASA